METEKLVIRRNGADPSRPWERVVSEPRGTLYQLESGREFCHLLAIVCPPVAGAYRGRHFHREKREEFFLVQGRMRFCWYDLDTDARGGCEIVPGDRLLILPWLAHAFVALEESVLVEFAQVPYAESDSIPADPLDIDRCRELGKIERKRLLPR